MPIVLDGTAGITTPEIVSTGGPLVVNESAPDNSVVVDASGNVGIGTSSPVSSNGNVGRVVQAASTGNTSSSIVASTAGVGVDNAGIFEARATAQTSGADRIGQIYIGRENTSTTALSGYMGFGTSNSGSFAERMRIDSSGNLLVGTASLISGVERFVVVNPAGSGDWNSVFSNPGASPFGINIRYSAASPNGTGNRFLDCVDSTALRAQIRSNGGLANYSANNANLSDRREKTNFAPAKAYLETICAIPVQTFNYIDQNQEEDPGLTLGVVAQDVQAVAPELVMESNWGTKEEPKMRLSVYQTDLQYALMKCIQELKAINEAQAQTIESLTARVVALEQA